MSEGTNLEAEIAALNQQIEAKRSQLERERGGAVEKEVALHHVVAGLTQAPSANPAPPAALRSTTPNAKSYLDTLSPEETAKVNALIDLIPYQGLSKTIEAAKREAPFVLDAFHDALMDKLKAELKKQNLL